MYSQFIFVFIKRVTLKANVNSEGGRKIKKSIDIKLKKKKKHSKSDLFAKDFGAYR